MSARGYKSFLRDYSLQINGLIFIILSHFRSDHPLSYFRKDMQKQRQELISRSENRRRLGRVPGAFNDEVFKLTSITADVHITSLNSQF